MPRLFPFFIVAVFAVTTCPETIATPLQVRARTQLDVRVDSTRDGPPKALGSGGQLHPLSIYGKLETDQGQPIPDAEVRVQVEDKRAIIVGARRARSRTLLTNHEGVVRFQIMIQDWQSGADPVEWTVSFDGDAVWGPAQGAGVIDKLASSRITLALEPAETYLDGRPMEARVAVTGEEGPVGAVPVLLRVGVGAELVGATDANGQVVFLLHPALLGVDGRAVVNARWAGNHRYGPDEVERAIHVFHPSRVTARVAREGGLERGRYRFSGRLSDHRGPIRNGAITLRVTSATGTESSVSLTGAVTQTDERGNYVLAVPTQALATHAPSVVDAQVVYVPGDGLHMPAMSAVVHLPTPGPPGVPLQWYGAVAMVALFGLAVIQLARGESWRHWLERLQRRSGHVRSSSDGATHAPEVRSRPARPNWITLILVDSRDGRTVPGVGVDVGVTRGGMVVPAQDDDGAYAWGPLEPGEYTLTCSVPGYMPAERALRIPHEGSWDGARFPMAAVRGHVLAAFTRALARVGVNLRWGYETPAEAMERCSELTAEAERALDALRSETESAWFSARPAEPGDAQNADALAAHVEGGS